MFHLTQILVPLIVGGQQRHSDDSIGEGGLGEAAPLVPHACAAWPQLCGRQQLRGQQAQLERGLALAGAVVLRLLVVEGLVRLGPRVEEGMQGSDINTIVLSDTAVSVFIRRFITRLFITARIVVRYQCINITCTRVLKFIEKITNVIFLILDPSSPPLAFVFSAVSPLQLPSSDHESQLSGHLQF